MGWFKRIIDFFKLKKKSHKGCTRHPSYHKEHIWEISRAPNDFGNEYCMFCGEPKNESEA